MTESPTKFIAANGSGGCVLIPRDSTHREVTKVFTDPMHARIECAANLKLLAGVGETLYHDRYVAMLDDMYTIMSYGEFKTTYEDTCFEFFEEGLQNFAMVYTLRFERMDMDFYRLLMAQRFGLRVLTRALLETAKDMQLALSVGIVHLDLAPRNLLCSLKPLRVKVGDWGWTEFSLQKGPITRPFIYNFETAPELVALRSINSRTHIDDVEKAASGFELMTHYTRDMDTVLKLVKYVTSVIIDHFATTWTLAHEDCPYDLCAEWKNVSARPRIVMYMLNNPEIGVMFPTRTPNVSGTVLAFSNDFETLKREMRNVNKRVLKSGGYDLHSLEAADVYGFGVVLLRTMVANPPANFTDGQVETLVSPLLALSLQMIQLDPSKRPSWAQVVDVMTTIITGGVDSGTGMESTLTAGSMGGRSRDMRGRFAHKSRGRRSVRVLTRTTKSRRRRRLNKQHPSTSASRSASKSRKHKTHDFIHGRRKRKPHT
jgi:hypothetical protein